MAATTQSSIELQEAENYLRRLTGPPPISKFWSPPEDPDKPRLPYIPGFTVQIRRHVPLPPFGGPDYRMGTREELSESYLREITQSELAIDRPGLDTTLPALSETAQLTVMTSTTNNEVRGAQVVACEIPPREKGDQPVQAVPKSMIRCIIILSGTLVTNLETPCGKQTQTTAGKPLHTNT